MTINFEKHKNELLFVPLGGAGEIGMNCNLYYHKGKWIMFDCGAGFAEDFMPGIDMIVPDIEFIAERKKDLLGIVLTHAHEDHVGAVHYLWNELQCPVYATPFTASFLREKLVESSFKDQVKIIEVESGSKFDVDPFKVQLVELTHSVPEMNAAFVHTEHGTVLHTGDWKFDPEPQVGPVSNHDALKKYGDDGILAMICDSTNIFKEGWSGSEGELRESLTKIIGDCEQMAVVTTFASNVARIETIALAAEAAGRRVVLAGRSLWRIARCAQENGYLDTVQPFLTDKEIGNHPRDKLLILCTGCQGEPLAATAKLANGSHPTIRLNPGDTIIFSSKIIPGNEKRIFRAFNKFIRMGVEVITERDHFVHVSGHPSRDELEEMFKMVRPKIAIPVHGEKAHMHEHAKFAKSLGVEEVVEVENGSVVKLAPGKPEHLAVVDAGFFGVDGYYLQPPDGQVMRMRRKMQRDGIIVGTIIIDRDDRLAADPIISAPGVLDPVEDADIFDAMVEEVMDNIETSRKQMRRAGMPTEHMSNLTRSAIRRILRREIGKNPVIDIRIERVK